ncbi:MAG: MbtH family NRPS accessory protein [Agarilytica sp.]
MVGEVHYLVVVNEEGQYSIWPAGMELPNGWDSDGKASEKSECLLRIKNAWKDLRPASLKSALAAH